MYLLKNETFYHMRHLLILGGLCSLLINNFLFTAQILGELSGRMLDSRLKGRRFEPQWCHCVVVLEENTFILA